MGTAPPRLNSDNNWKPKVPSFTNVKWPIPCSKRGVTGRQCNSVYTRDTPSLQKATGNYITVNGSWHSFSMLCNCQPIRFFQHFMWPSTNQIPTAHHVTIEQSDSYSMSCDLQPITSLKHVMWPSTNQVQPHFHPQPQLIGLAVVLLAMRAGAMRPRMTKRVEQSHLLSNCTTVTMPPGSRGRLRMLSHTWTMRHPLLA